jgi:hypothetical protein
MVSVKTNTITKVKTKNAIKFKNMKTKHIYKIQLIKTVLMLTVLFGALHLKAQDIQWQKKLGGIHADYLFDAMPTLDYGFIMVGGSLSNNTGDVSENSGDFDYFITKLSEYGNLEWTTTLGGTKMDMLKSITNSYDGGYLVAGISNSEVSNSKTTKLIGQQDIWLIKISIEGQIEWQKSLGGLANEDVSEVIKTKDGGFLIAGSSASGTYISDNTILETPNRVFKQDRNKGNLDYWLIKLDVKGDQQWQKTFGGKYKDVLNNVLELPNGDIVIAGSSNSPLGLDKKTTNKGLTDWWVLKLNNKGDTLWQKSFGDDGDDQLHAMLFTKDEHLILGGHFRARSDEGLGNSDFVIIKLDLEGEQVWKNTFSEGTNDILTDIVQNVDGTLLVSGYTASERNSKPQKPNAKPESGTEDFMVLKINSDGEDLWRKNIGTDKKEVLHKSIKTRDGGYVLMGSSMPFKAAKTNDANFWIVKLLDKDKPQVEKLPIEAVPNPTRDYTQVIIGEDYEQATVMVSDMAGRILQNFKVSKKRIIPVNLESYPDGVYIVNVRIKDQSKSVKIAKISK